MKMKNYFNTLSREQQKEELGKCEFLGFDEFTKGVEELTGKKIVIVGCGAQGLNQGLNMRDSGLNVSYALRKSSLNERNTSFINATSNGFECGDFEQMIPQADLVVNLTPDKQHTPVVSSVVPLMKKGATLSYSHGFNIVEEGVQIRQDITVIMVAPKSPGSEVRREFERGFGVPTLIAVHPENDPEGKGLEWAKSYAVAIGGHRAGVLLSSFTAEVKSDLMGEQTILCGVLQSASVLLFDKMVAEGVEPSYASKFMQFGWEAITEALKHGGISGMMNRLSEQAQLEAYRLSEELKMRMTNLFNTHMEEILSGTFSENMMKDWRDHDAKLLGWRSATAKTPFEKAVNTDQHIAEDEFFQNGTLVVAFIKAGVELAFDVMVSNGIKEESAYYESLHELPLIANTIARKKLYEMNRIISDTAEYGCYLFDHACQPLIADFVAKANPDTIGKPLEEFEYNEAELQMVREAVINHPIEKVGKKLRDAMKEESRRELQMT